MKAKLAVVLGLTVAGVAHANLGTVTVPNGSFESPALPFAPPFASATLSDWQDAPVPQYWLDAGFTAQQWDEGTGVFVNFDPDPPNGFGTPISNADGNQIGFLFSRPDSEIFQELAAVYEPGVSYDFTVGMQGGGFNMPLGQPLELRFYYLNDLNERVTIDSLEILNTDPGPDQDFLTDRTLTLAEVQPGDAWANKEIGLQIITTPTDLNSAGGFWVLDNVRVTGIPEPASLSLLGLGTLVLRRRR